MGRELDNIDRQLVGEDADVNNPFRVLVWVSSWASFVAVIIGIWLFAMFALQNVGEPNGEKEKNPQTSSETERRQKEADQKEEEGTQEKEGDKEKEEGSQKEKSRKEKGDQEEGHTKKESETKEVGLRDSRLLANGKDGIS